MEIESPRTQSRYNLEHTESFLRLTTIMKAGKSYGASCNKKKPLARCGQDLRTSIFSQFPNRFLLNLIVLLDAPTFVTKITHLNKG